MTTENMTLPERVATLEEAYKHLATREDLAENIASVNATIAELKILIANQNVLTERVQVNSTRWTIATIIAATALAVAAVKLL